MSIASRWMLAFLFFFFFFLNDPAPPEISPLPLHDALPICARGRSCGSAGRGRERQGQAQSEPCRPTAADRKSTRLNSSHSQISYAVFCLKKKKKKHERTLLSMKSKHHVHTLHATPTREVTQ